MSDSEAKVKAPTYHNLSAGSTAIMESGKVIKFGGSVKQVEGGTQVGLGTYSTNDPAEIEFLDGLCKMQSPQVWKEVEATPEAPDVTEIPKNVAAGLPTDTAKVVSDVIKSAATSVDNVAKDPKVEALLAKAASNSK